MRITKKILSVVLTLAMVLGTVSVGLGCIGVSAAYSDGKLKFNSNGEFKILQLADIQDSYAADGLGGGNGSDGFDWRTRELIQMAILETNPDLIVLTGDNFVGTNDTEIGTTTSYFNRSVKEVTDMFKDRSGNDIPWTMTFGNHDYKDNKLNGTSINESTQYDEMSGYGAFIDYDSTSSITGQSNVKGTGKFSIYDTTGSSIIWDILMVNTGDDASSGYGRPGSTPGSTASNDTQYNAVVSWVNNRANKTNVPAVAFQHIPLQEFYSKLLKSGGSIPAYTNNLYSGNFTPKSTSEVADITGEYNEQCCCSYYSTLDYYNALTGSNVKGLFFGHDHTNTLQGTVDGMMQAYCPGSGHIQYDGGSNAGVRTITLKTDKSFSTNVIKETELRNKYESSAYGLSGHKYYYGNATFLSPNFAITKFGKDSINELSALATLLDSDGGIYEPIYLGALNEPKTTFNFNEPKSGKSQKGDYILMGNQRTDNPNNAIVGLAVYWSGSNRSGDEYNNKTFPDGVTYHQVAYKKIYTGGTDSVNAKQDLNSHAGGDYIYLYYATASDFTAAGKTVPPPITAAALASSDSYTNWTITKDDDGNSAELNHGYTDGRYLRFYYQTSLKTGIEDITADYDALVETISEYQTAYNSADSYTSETYNPFKTKYEAATTAKNAIDNLSGFNLTYSKAILKSLKSELDTAYNALEKLGVVSGVVASEGVYFNVPENIYLTPGGKTFQYFQDQTINVNTSSGTATIIPNANATDTSGNVEFYCKNANSVTITYSTSSVDHGYTVSCTGFPSTANSLNNAKYTTSISSGSFSTAASDYIKWTATYTDTVDGQTKSVTAFTYVYAPLYGNNSVVASQTHTGLTKHDKGILNEATWIAGIQGIETYSGGTNADKKDNCSYKFSPYGGSTLITKSASSTDPSNSDTLDGCYVESTGNKGYSGYWWKDTGSTSGDGDTRTQINYYKGYNYVDTSRITNLNQIPNFRFGVDIFENWASSGGTRAMRLGCYKNGDTATDSNLVSEQSVGSGGTRWKNFVPNISISGLTSNSTYFLRGYCKVRNSGYQCTTYVYTPFDLRPTDKSTLRSNVLAAQARFGDLGFVNDTTSLYFDTTNSKWIAFVDAYNTAYKNLTKLDGSPSVNGSNLQTLIDDVINNCPRKWSSTAKIYNVAKSNGTNPLRALANAPEVQRTITYQTGYDIKINSGFNSDYTGYTFVGYAVVTPNTERSAYIGQNSPSTSSSVNIRRTVTQNIRILAIYTPKTYTVSFNQSCNPSVTAYYGDLLPSFTGGIPTKNGYTFNGYYEYENGNGTEYYNEAGNSVSVWSKNAGATLYANWTLNNYVITYVDSDGTTTLGTEVYTITSTEEFATFAKTGNTFDYWEVVQTVSGLNGNWTQGEKFNVDGTAYGNGQNADARFGNVTLKAHWTAITYTIQYNANGGTGTTVSSTHTYDIAKALTLNGFTKTGYSFAGWSTTSNGTVVYSNGDSVINLAEDNGDIVTLYAIWESGISDDTFVVDSGVPVLLNVTSNDGGASEIIGFSATENGTYNTTLKGSGFDVSISNGKALLILNSIGSTVSFWYKGSNGVAQVKIIPATNVYYEESFITFEDTDSNKKWGTVGNTDLTVTPLDALRSGDAVGSAYGQVSANTASNSATYSLGTAKKIELTSTDSNKFEKAYAEFSFTGTGFSVYSLLSMETGYVKIVVTDNNLDDDDEEKENQYVVSLDNGYEYGQLFYKDGDLSFDSTGEALYDERTDNSVCYKLHGKQYYTNGAEGKESYGWLIIEDTDDETAMQRVPAIYQSPVISKTGLPYSNYTVQIIPKYNSKNDINNNGKCEFYFDSVRIYDPINPENLGDDAAAAYMADREYDAQYKCIRTILKDSKSLGELPGGSEKVIGIAFLGTLGKEGTSLDTYLDIGPKNEVYLGPNDTIAFNITTESSTLPAKLALGMKLAYGSGTGTITVNNQTISTSVSTEQYRNVVVDWTTENNVYVASFVITNTSSVPVSLTNFRYSYSEAATKAASAPARAKMLAAPVAEESRELTFYFSDDLLRHLSVKPDSKDDLLIDYEDVSVNWSCTDIELGNTVTLSVECPEIITKITADGQEITSCTELENGKKIFMFTVTPEAVGNYEYNIVLFDRNGYNSKAILSPVCRVVEPKIDINDVEMIWNSDAIKLGESATLTLNTNEKIKAVIIGDETITDFTEENGRHIFTRKVTPAAIGKYSDSVVLQEIHGYKSTSFSTPLLTVASYVVSTDGIEIKWNKDTFEVGEDIVLTVKTPADIKKVTADGQEITDCEENSDGTKTFTLKLKAENDGKLEYAVRLTDENGMISKTVSTGSVDVNSPVTDKPAENEPAKLTFWQWLWQFIRNHFGFIINLIKGVFPWQN